VHQARGVVEEALMGVAIRANPLTIDDLLVVARSGLRRLDPLLASRAVRGGAVLVDTRPEWQRRKASAGQVTGGSHSQESVSGLQLFRGNTGMLGCPADLM
jgi:hypothetical protein